jgi:Putative DNA-binding domain
VTDPRTEAWLADFQRRFSDLIRTPLDRSRGTLRALGEHYDAELTADVQGAARERLAVYHRQYWFRLFTTLQREYPLCARLLGMWNFNGLAADYLRAHPPAHYDLQRCAHAFVPFLEQTTRGKRLLSGIPSEALCESARIDRAFSRVFLAPEVAPLAQLPRENLAAVQLQLAPTVELVTETWPWLELRKQVAASEKFALPGRHARPLHFAVFRTATGHGVAPLEPVAHRLFSLLAERPIGAALAELEASCDEAVRQSLPGQVQTLLARSVKLAFWQQTSVEP